MGNKVTVELKGLRELMDALDAMPAEVKRGPIIYRALHDGARVIVPEAQRRAPVLQDTRNRHRQRGALRSAITQHASKREKFVVDIRVRNRGYIFGPGADTRRNPIGAERAGNPNYWWLVHFGTSKVPPNPFLYTAFEVKKNQAATAIQLSLLRGVFSVAQKLGFDVKGWV